MTRSLAFARISLTSARWLLPWIGVLFVSATLVYAIGTSTQAGSSASDQAEVHATVSTGGTEAVQSTAWLSETVTESYGSRSGAMSSMSPASTGHASPDGCCTWDGTATLSAATAALADGDDVRAQLLATGRARGLDRASDP